MVITKSYSAGKITLTALCVDEVLGEFLRRGKWFRPCLKYAFVIDKMNTLRSFFETTLWAQLGPLERQVLEAVWGRGSATVHEVREDVAIWQTYTTIMTTMDRLFKKGLFDRTPDGRAFRYSARYSPKELQSMSAASSIKQILASEYALLHLSYFVEAVGAHDAKLLDQLQALVERQRAQLGKGEQK